MTSNKEEENKHQENKHSARYFPFFCNNKKMGVQCVEQCLMCYKYINYDK